ncbi:hypothetical protein Tsubulata_044914 [Turnera subulata]|uniref:non-specific serine/threonine protein kinase n=1 Tax=Turnera subulata TaxID=218843 RepID=A0A9Q0FIE2_9ROSI|nr:hypothetical protein Tsubulata_044914 [Turnera subulata]
MGVEDYHVIEMVGEGSFGKVYKGRRKCTGQTVAMKFIMKHGKSDRDIHSLRQEIEILRKLKHQNIIQMLDSFESPQEFCVVTEFAQGEVFEILEDDKCLPEEQVQAIAKQLVRALHYLHSNRIIHRDMKPQNILIGAGSVIKLCDFGFARAMSMNTVVLRSIKGTPLYMAPELVREQPYNHTADLWSLGVILYELFVGQPPFYADSVYTLIHRIVEDTVTYPDDISSNFKSFLKGLLKKVPQNRLSWPALLEHPFVKETSDDLETRELCDAAGAASKCDATRKCEEHASQQSAGLVASSPEGNQILDRLENNSLTVKGAHIIGQDTEALTLVLLPLKRWLKGSEHSNRDQDILTSSQSLRIISNLAAAGAVHSSGLLDEILSELLDFSSTLSRLNSLELTDLITKSLSILKLLFDHSGNGVTTSCVKHWIALTEIFSQIVSGNEDTSGRVLHEACACVVAMLSTVAQGFKATMKASGLEEASSTLMNETMKRILDHTKNCGLVEHLSICLATSGSSLISGSPNMLRAACEACRAIWLLIDATEAYFMKGNAFLFPLNALRKFSLQRLDIRDHERGSLIGTDSAKIVDVFARAFLRSKAVQVAIYCCLQKRLGATLCATVQLLSRCCLHSAMVPGVLCGLPSSLPVSTVVSGGGDRTIISEVFSILSLRASSSNKDPPTGESKLANITALVLHASVILATVAQCLKSTGRSSALFMLTTSPKKQLSRLSLLAQQCSPEDRVAASLQPHCAAAMLALASILSLESKMSVESSFLEVAMPLIPQTATLCEHLNISSGNQNEVGPNNIGVLSYWHGLRDGCVGLLESRLKLGGPLAVKQLCASGTPLLLIELLADKFLVSSPQGTDSMKDNVGLSPVGVLWTISSICHCVSGGAFVFRQILVRSEHVKLISDLISDVHLKLVKSWGGPGGGKDGVRDVINSVIDLLAFPLVAEQNASSLPSTNASVTSGLLLNVGSPGGRMCMEDEDMVEAIKEDMEEYLKILLEIGVPIMILRCLEHMDLKDYGRPVAFLAKMACHRPLAVQLVSEGLLDQSRCAQLLLNELGFIGRQGFYKHIDGASILGFLKDFLTHEDPNICAKACSALGNMCRHSSDFYDSLARNHIIGLLIDRCADPDTRTRKFACFAIGNAAYYNDELYEELRGSIPQLVNILLSAEEDKTKANAACALTNLVRNSNALCDDIVSCGAVQV